MSKKTTFEKKVRAAGWCELRNTCANLRAFGFGPGSMASLYLTSKGKLDCSLNREASSMRELTIPHINKKICNQKCAELVSQCVQQQQSLQNKFEKLFLLTFFYFNATPFNFPVCCCLFFEQICCCIFITPPLCTARV